MTVYELRAELETWPDEEDDLEVWLEGCDCYNPMRGVSLQTDMNGEPYILLTIDH